MDFLKMKGIVLQKYFSRTRFADAINWSRNKTSRILNGVNEPSIDDIVEITVLIELDEKTFFDIFFAACPHCIESRAHKAIHCN